MSHSKASTSHFNAHMAHMSWRTFSLRSHFLQSSMPRQLLKLHFSSLRRCANWVKPRMTSRKFQFAPMRRVFALLIRKVHSVIQQIAIIRFNTWLQSHSSLADLPLVIMRMRLRQILGLMRSARKSIVLRICNTQRIITIPRSVRLQML